MKANTQSVTIEIEPRRVFDFIANPQNLPKWAVGFCRNIRRDGDDWVVDTGNGEVTIRYATDPATGVIDYHIVPAPGIELVAHSRVLPNVQGAEYVFTQFQSAGMTDAVFEAQVETLNEELSVLRSVLRAQSTCPGGRAEA